MIAALIQLDTLQEQPAANLPRILDAMRRAHADGAGAALFHEGTLTDYVSDVDAYAQPVPDGPACTAVATLARELGMWTSVGLIEADGDARYITQAFFGPEGYITRYRKTWLHQTDSEAKKRRHRNEYDDFDPGQGPVLFSFAGFRTASMICADANAPQCLRRMRALAPELVIFPNNRARWRDDTYWEEIARAVDAPLLVTNRVGPSWGAPCPGGSAAYARDGRVLAKANLDGREEYLMVDLASL